MKSSLIVCIVVMLLPCVAYSTPIPDTGQIKCYDDIRGEITCPDSGEPFYGQDAQYIGNPRSYTDLGNGIVRDNVTGLEWQQGNAPGNYTWQHAIDYCDNLTLGGYYDWRLPTVKELCSLIDNSIQYPGPTINTDYFPITQSFNYWSSTVHAFAPDSAWTVYFDGGSVYSRLKTLDGIYVRAVRAGLSGSFDKFVDNLDGTITDRHTGLLWQKDIAPGKYDWQQALSYCENLMLAGYNDWRLPNRNELQSIVDYDRCNPSLDPVFLTTGQSSECYYWSSTTGAYNPYGAWVASFQSGHMHPPGKSDYNCVRAVRGNPCDTLGDSDGDTLCDNADNCMYDYNLFQRDCDSDSTGDVCDMDTIDPDGDGVDVACDNCPDNSNPNQKDTYPPQGNDIGDACDCEGNFNCSSDQDIDGSDAALFKADFGRSVMVHPCIAGDTGNGDFSCDGDVDGTDASLFKQDFGRSQFQNPCPACVSEEWCTY